MTRPRTLYRQTYQAHSSAGEETLKALQSCPSMLDVQRADILAAGIALVEGEEMNFIELRIYAKRHIEEADPRVQVRTSERRPRQRRPRVPG